MMSKTVSASAGVSPSSLQLTTTTALLLFLSTSLLQIGITQGFDCDAMCFSDYSTRDQPNCEIVNPALECYLEHQAYCTSQFAQSIIEQLENDHDIMGCDPVQTEPQSETVTTVTATTTTPVTPPSCPRVPPFALNPTTSLSSPEIFPTMANRDCVEYNPQRLQHCSLFGFSNLRPFRSYRSGLEACNIPGSWYLLRHRTVSVEVEGVASGMAFDHTKLTKVNVTFYRSGSCLRETKSYVATFNSSLSLNFTDQTVPGNCSANLHLSVDADGTVASLLATWINTTIVIRRHADLLSVTVQVPGHLAFESDGLCRGCPAHAYVNMTRFNELMTLSDHCDTESTAATYLCFFGFANRLEFDSIINASYSDMCIYSMWRGNTTNYDVLSLLIAVSNDAKMLPDQGYIPPRTYETIAHDGIVDPSVTDDMCNPSRETNSTDPTNTTDATTRAVTTTTDTTDSIATTTRDDSSLRTTTTERGPSEQPQTPTNAEQTDEEMPSATCKNQRLSVSSLLTASLLSLFTARLLLR